MIYGGFGVGLYCPKLVIYQFLSFLPVKDIEDSGTIILFPNIFGLSISASIVHLHVLSREKLGLVASEFNQFVEQEIIKTEK